MLKKNSEDSEFQKREEFKQDETGIKHQSHHPNELANDWKKTPEWAVNHVTPAVPVSELISLAKKIERLQQIKEKNLGDDLSSLGETAWKILIRLVIATEERQSITLADISRQISLPQTIADRYMIILENKGHIMRSPHPTDQNGQLLRLTTEGQSIMRKTLLELDKI